MLEFLRGFMAWPNVMWMLGSAMMAMFVLVAWLDDKRDWKGWAALFHFVAAGVAGLSWFWGNADGLIYQVFSRHAFWVNVIALAVYLALTWWQDRKYDCLIAIDDD